MSNINADDIKKYFSENESNHVSGAQTTKFEYVDNIKIKEEPLELEPINNVNESKDPVNMLHECMKVEKFEMLDIGDHVISCKEELQDTFMGDFDVEAKLKKELDISNYGLNYESCKGICNDFCYKCQKIIQILDGPVNKEDKEGTISSNNVLDIKVGCTKGIFALYIIPEGIKFGPYEVLDKVLTEDGCAWILKDGKFVEATSRKETGWMSLVNCASDSANQNLIIVQNENHLYYQSKRQIEKGEELLLYLGEEHVCSFKTKMENYYYPPVENHVDDIYACTHCCVGFGAREHLVRHQIKCPHAASNSTLEEIVQCSLCKIYMDEREYKESHKSSCSSIYSRKYIQSKAGVGSSTEEVKYDFDRRGNVEYACDRCDYKDSVESDFRRHMEEEHSGSAIRPNGVEAVGGGSKEESFAYQSYNFRKSKTSLLKHIGDLRPSDASKKKKKRSRGRNQKRIECKICNKTFTTNQNLKTHLLIHAGEKPYACHRCDYKSRRKALLVDHLICHDGATPYECTICNKSYSTRQNLKRHIRIHSGEKPFACHRCDYKFSEKGSLVRHLKRHDSVRQFECTVCSKSFVAKHCLQTHLRIHAGEKFLACHLCDYKCNYKQNLVRHLKRHG